MKNKIVLKKTIIYSIIAIIIFNISFFILDFYQYKKYTDNFNLKITAILSKVNEKYPNVNKDELIEILNSDKLNEVSLKEYGIDIDEDSLILENDRYFFNFSLLSIFTITIMFVVLISIFLKYNHSKDKKLKEITKYIEEINNKNYKLDIEDNTEDELSILKNEIYKTTIMLKEVAENSMKDKTCLKDSLSDISHQLKTPLTSIIIMLDNILDNPNMDDATKNEFIKDIKREIVNINFLVESLLKISKLDASSVTFINKYEYIEDIINESIKNVSTLCDLKNIDIKTDIDKNIKLFCDFKWQVEAITNILKNCVEHSSSNSKIIIKASKNKTYAKIEIIDNGVGIYKEDLPHIFERFYKGKNSSSESVGIGLALSKSIIEKSNGYIDVESEVGKGTKFLIKYFNY